MSTFIKKRFKVILSNNGNKGTSIIDYSIYLKVSIKDKPLYIWMKSFNPKLISLSNDTFILPVNIDAGSSVAFYVDIQVQNECNKLNDTDYIIKFKKQDGTIFEAVLNPNIIFALQR